MFHLPNNVLCLESKLCYPSISALMKHRPRSILSTAGRDNGQQRPFLNGGTSSFQKACLPVEETPASSCHNSTPPISRSQIISIPIISNILTPHKADIPTTLIQINQGRKYIHDQGFYTQFMYHRFQKERG